MSGLSYLWRQMSAASKLHDPALRKLRALRIIEQRIIGMSLKQIGLGLGIEALTVSDEINWAKRQGLMDTLENQILSELVPAAIGAAKKAMDSGDVTVALAVFNGTGLFRKTAERPIALPGATPGEESLEVHVKRINRSAAPAAQEIAPSGTSGAQLGSVGQSPALGAAPLEAELVTDSSEARPQDTDGGVEQSLNPEPGELEHYLAQARNEVG